MNIREEEIPELILGYLKARSGKANIYEMFSEMNLMLASESVPLYVVRGLLQLLDHVTFDAESGIIALKGKN